MIEHYKNKNVLITGGLGFLGSSLSIKLVEMGAKVVLLDNMQEGHGGNLFNIEPVKDRVTVNYCDVRDRGALRCLIKNQDFVFHLAGQVNHLASIKDPLLDFDINVVGTMTVLEAIRLYAPDVKFVFSGTRGQYGATVKLPVSETHPMKPKGLYGISNLTAEMAIEMYHSHYGMRTVGLRITNTYGPRHQMAHDQYGVANWFIRRAMEGKIIHLFGGGHILRDFLFVDDTIQAILMAGSNSAASGRVLNVGSGQGISFTDLAKKVTQVIGSGSYEVSDFPKERKDIEPGDYVADCTLIKETIGWEAKTPLEDGIAKTADYYRAHQAQYWQTDPA